MAELTAAAEITTSSCCAPEARATCCEPSEKHRCCTHTSSKCGCSESQTATPGSEENLAASTTDCDPHTTLANPYRESGDGSRSRPRLEFREITELSG